MSRIDDLIKQYAPSGVEYRTLGEVGSFVRGNGLQKKDLLDVGVPAIHYGQVHTVYGVWTTETVSYVAPEFAARLRKAEPGNLVIATTSEDDDAVAKATAWLGEVDAAVSGDAYIYRHVLEPKYVAYFFRSEQFQNQKKIGITGTKVRRISGDSLAKIRIPVPPLEVQREIVQILDVFAAMTSSLQDEIALRQEQYAAISQRLFMQATAGTDVHDVARVRIGEVAKQCVRSEVLEPEEAYECLGVKWYGAGVYLRETRTGDEIKAKTLNRVKAGQFLYNRMFVTEGSFAVVPPELDGGVVSNEFPIYDLDESRVLPGWLRLSVLDEFALKRIEAETTGVERGSMKSRRRWKEDQFEAFMIELPSVAVQRRVLHILNVLNAFQEDLDAELRARRQQYAYYRDRLLTFEEAAA